MLSPPATADGTVRCLHCPFGSASLASRGKRERSIGIGTRVGGLDERERAILDFERDSWRLQVAKERAIRETFGISGTRYHQLLRRIVDRPEALAYDPMLVRRLRRLREIAAETPYRAATRHPALGSASTGRTRPVPG